MCLSEILFGALKACVSEAATSVVEMALDSGTAQEEFFAFRVKLGRQTTVYYTAASVCDLRRQVGAQLLTMDFHLTCGTHVLRPECEFQDYGLARLPRTNEVECSLHLKGGATQYLPLSWNTVIEKTVLTTSTDLACIPCTQVSGILSLQARDEDYPMDYVAQVYAFGKLKDLLDSFGSDVDARWVSTQVENVIHSYFWFKRTDDLYMWATLVYKLFTGRSASQDLMQKWKQIFGHGELQADVKDSIRQLREMIDNVTDVADSQIVQKVMKLYNYLLVQGFLTKLGLTLSEEDYSKLEMRTMQVAFSSRKGLVWCVLDTLFFLAERVCDFAITKDISVFIHSDREYVEWLKTSDNLLTIAPFSSNLEAHGTTYFQFISDLSDVIEKGEAYVKYSKARSGVETNIFKVRLNKLKMVKATELTRRAAQKERSAPFGVLLHGPSSVAKSSFAKMLYFYYGQLFGLPIEDEFRFVRNPADEYWSNFATSMWCIQMDDIAFMKPQKCADVDPTLKELLNVVNNVPYVPPQAELENKGRTPVQARLVTATSNSITLNAHEYFYCPLAVRRRLPYVISVKPKQEYLHSNGRFIAPERLPEPSDSFPDFWEISVMEIVPVLEGDTERAQLRTRATYTDVREFLKDFGTHAKQHEMNQMKAMSSDVGMRSVGVCKTCLAPRPCDCPELQADEFVMSMWRVRQEQSRATQCFAWLGYYLSLGYITLSMWSIQFGWFKWLLRWCAIRNLVYRWVAWTFPEAAQFRALGYLNGISLAPGWWQRHQYVIRLVAGVVGASAVLYTVKKSFDTPKKEEVEEELQGMARCTEDQLEREERRNVWYNPTTRVNTFDLPTAGLSLNGKTAHELRDIFARNCVFLTVTCEVSGVLRRLSQSGVFVKGHLILANSHLFVPGAETYRVQVVTGPVEQGVNTNVEFTLSACEIVHLAHKDMCMFSATGLPPRKDITRFWAKARLSVTLMTRIRRDLSGSCVTDDVFGVDVMPDCSYEFEETHIFSDMYRGTMLSNTQVGDCGALVVARLPVGSAIVGIHTLGNLRSAVAIGVYYEDIEFLMSKFDAQVDGAGAPSIPEGKTLQPLHHKSLVRYLPDAKIELFGSFPGFRPRPKTKVKATPLQKEMCEHFGIEVEHAAPVMGGWEPWHNNVKEMVKPFYDYDRTVLDECVAGYVSDVVGALPPGWERELMFLSDKASVNGLPGVCYIDGINRSSSMGFPRGGPKSRFLVPDSDERYPDGVTFVPEVWEEVAAVKQAYAEGRRSYPVFTAHLKDEAVPHAKVEAKKTRLFTGAPVAWSLVVRSRLLSFVRLLQKNKFAFEAGPGTVSQSIEWSYIYDYLTEFGEDRMIGGDYGKFDKRMLADFVLAAFKVIRILHEKAGFTANESQEIMCIGEDTAFSMCDLTGELVQFLGTNPSGHPMTVIVNSIVNSLYMRYAYHQLNPDREVVSFRKNVRLFTYGDDNTMGVSRSIEWYNHTSVQTLLATIGVEYTMADKQAASVPFVHIDTLSFLKRRWVWCEEVRSHKCPLEMESIHKSLTVWVPSSSVDCYQQMIDVIIAANNEFFFHGKEIFKKHHVFFEEILAREEFALSMGARSLPSWGELVARYERASQDVAEIYGREY